VIVSIGLEQLRCNAENHDAHPYLWVQLLQIDDDTTAVGGPGVALVAFPDPPIGAQVVIQEGMRAGDSAPIPDPMARLATGFRPGQGRRDLILVAVLWDRQDTPGAAVLAGYEAFLAGVRDAVAANLVALNTAPDRQPIIDAIKAAASKQIHDAIANQISWFEGLFETQDALIDSQFVLFEQIDEKDSSTAFTVAFGADTPHAYQVDCKRVVTADPCEAELIRIQAARETIANTRGALKQLGEGNVADQKREELEAELEAQTGRLVQAEADLKHCRTITGAGGKGNF
jgi:hypothetical protein